LVNKAVEKMDDVELLNTCSLCLLYSCRTASASELISNLVRRMHGYPASPSPEDFLSSALVKGVEPSAITPHQQKAFCLVAKAMYENFPVCGPHLPMIFQNAFVLFAPSRPHSVPEAELVLHEALLAVITPHPGAGDWVTQRKQAEDLLQKKSKWNPTDLACILDVLANKFSDLREDWAEICLDWSYQITEEEAAIDSIHLFCLLTNKYTISRTRRLVMGLVKAIIYNQDFLRDAFFDALSLAPEELQSEWQCWQLIGIASASLCATCNIDQFVRASRLLQNIFSCEEPLKIVSALDPLWKEPLSLETIILRGLSCAETTSDALWLCNAWIKTHKNPSNTFLILSLLTNALQCITKSPVAAPQHAMHFLNTSENATCQKFLDVFAKMDLRDVPLQKQPEAASLAKDFFTVFSAVFSESFDFVIDVILVLLHRAQKKWRVVLLQLLHLVLTDGDLAVSDPVTLKRIVEVIVYYSQSQESDVANSATALLPYVIRNLPEGVPVKYFEYLRASPPDISTATATRRFVGETDTHSFLAKFHCIEKVLHFGLGFQMGSSLMKSFTAEAVVLRASKPSDSGSAKKNSNKRPYAPKIEESTPILM